MSSSNDPKDEREQDDRREYFRERAREKYRANHTPAQPVQMKISRWTVDEQGNKSRTIEGK
jgi:hypothetical protein